MPRRWIYPREEQDYSRLHGRPLAVILDGAIANRPYGAGVPTFAATVNADLLVWFEGREILTASDALATMEATRGMRGWSEEFVCDWVGTRLGWGMHLDLIREVTEPGGERSWTMPDREPFFDVHNGKARRVRGLPPIEQIAMNKRRAREVALNATLDAKHARKIAPEIQAALDRMLAAEPDVLMPAGWSAYVAADVMEKWPRVVEAHGILRELHHGMGRERQKKWLRHVRADADAVSFDASRREAERQAATEAAVVEDAGAFAGL